jgi:hypothetical protein
MDFKSPNPWFQFIYACIMSWQTECHYEKFISLGLQHDKQNNISNFKLSVRGKFTTNNHTSILSNFYVIVHIEALKESEGLTVSLTKFPIEHNPCKFYYLPTSELKTWYKWKTLYTSYSLLARVCCVHYLIWRWRPQNSWICDSINENLTSYIKVKGKVVPVLNLIKHYAMKAYGGVDV